MTGASAFRTLSFVVATVLIVAAPGSAAGSKVPRAGDQVVISGGTLVERKLARLVALRVGGVTIRSARFERPSALLRHQGVRRSELFVGSSEPRTLRGEWELGLYGGTFAALASRYRVSLGGIATADREAPLRLWPSFDLYSQIPTARRVAALRERLIEAYEAANAKVLELRTATTPARAIALTLQVNDPAGFLKHRALSVLNVLYRTKVPLLGFYVGLEDANAKLVWATSRLPNEGGVFAIPSLDACSPVKHSEMVGAKELPCPAR